MTNTEQLTELLNDLVKINDERIKGYEKAADQTKAPDVDLQAVFLRLAGESQSYIKDLNEKIDKLGGQPSSDTIVSGKVHSVYMDAKACSRVQTKNPYWNHANLTKMQLKKDTMKH